MEELHLRDWLAQRVAAEARLDVNDVADDDPFDYFGLESAAAVTIAGELQDLLGRDVEPTALFDHPSIAQLSAHLTSGAVPQVSSAAPPIRTDNEQTAVVGMACRVPGAASVDEFWELLTTGHDAVRTSPPGRWAPERLEGAAGARYGGFLDRIDGFDASFFRIPHEEAVRMDPQQRLLLETSWEAFEDAGCPMSMLRGSRTGVYVGISLNEYARRQFVDDETLSGLTPTGNAMSVAANRLSYFYDLRGPSIAVDTACSSSLVALHLALQSVRSGECDQALVCGVNIILEPETSLALERAGMLAPDGRCKTFDSGANGYVRGEGCIAIVLKPIEKARLDGDRIYAAVLGSAVNQDGRTNGLTAPNPDSQVAVMRAAYASAGVDPRRVQYVECHGTGTFLGDPIEARSVGSVVGAGREPADACLIGSVKTNIGHLESAAGIAGLLKTVLALHHGTIPRTLNFAIPNPHIPFADLGLAVALARHDWPGDARRRVAGVSSFGFGGTNAHVVLGGAPRIEEPPQTPAADGPYLLPVSAHSPDALAATSRAFSDHLRGIDPHEVAAAVACASTRRTHLPHRRAVIGETASELADALARPGGSAITRPRRRSSARRVAFIFSGQGSQWAGMARGLLEREPLFRSTVARCDEALEGVSAWSIAAVLTDESLAGLLDKTEVAQPVLFAVEAGLVAIWRSFGVEATAVVGHSIGEVAAAFAAGSLTLAEGVRLAYARGQAMAYAAGKGRMLAVAAPAAEVASIAARFGVSVAAINGPDTVVLSGDASALAQIETEWRAEGRFARWLPVDYAFHSDQMEPAAAALASQLPADLAGPPKIRFYSTVTGGHVADELTTAYYWSRNVRETVRFGDAVSCLLDDGIDVLLEIGPSGALEGALGRIARERDDAPVVVASMRRETDDTRSLLEAAGQLYEAGVDLAWRRLSPAPSQVVSLPSYQWQRESHWFEVPSPVRRPTRSGHPLLGGPIAIAGIDGAMVWEVELTATSPSFLKDHQVLGTPVLSASCYVEMMLAAARAAGVPGPVLIDDVSLPAFLALDETPTRLQVTLLPRDDGFAALVHGDNAEGARADWTLYAGGRLRTSAVEQRTVSLAEAQRSCLEQVPKRVFYSAMGELGASYGSAFQTLADVWRRDGEAIGSLDAPDASFAFDPTVLDGALQLLAAAVGVGASDHPAPRVPTGFDRLTYWREPSGACRARAALHGPADATERTIRADVEIIDEDERLLLAVEGLRLERVRSQVAERNREDPLWLYELVWRETEPVRRFTRLDGRHVLLLGTPDGAAVEIASRLKGSGAKVAIASGGPDARPISPGQWRLRLDRRDDYERLLRELSLSGDGIDTVMHLCSLDHDHDAEGPASTRHAVSELVALMQAMSFMGGSRTPELWIVTEGASAVAPGEAVRNPLGSALWGLAKVVPFENPALQARCVDLDHADDCTELLLSEVAAPSDDAEIAFRQGRRYVHRLVAPAPVVSVASSAANVDHDGTYVVTGGLGALGLVVARWLAAKGAGRVALLGRTGKATSEVRELQENGADIVVLPCDVTSREQLASAIEKLRVSGPPLKGIVHAAGVLDDGPLMQMTASSVDTVFAPKVDGAWWLEEATRPDPVDWVVYFSSAASVLGSPGQGNYCAANAFLDGFSRRATTDGRSVCTINWGPWAGRGMAADWADDSSVATGYSVLSPEGALQVLDDVLADGRSQTLVLPFDLRHLLQFFPVGLGLTLFNELQDAELAGLRSIGLGSGRLARPELDHEYTAPRNHVERVIASIWQTSLGIDKVGAFDGFFELGGDSVFGNQILLDVGGALGVTIDADAAFEDFTVAAIAALAEAAMVGELQEMTEEDVERLLAEGH